MKRAIIFLGTLAVLVIVALGLMTNQYKQTDDYTSYRFDEGYIINGVRCYDMSYGDAVEKITEEWNAKDILVVGTMDEPLAVLKEYDCTYSITDQVARIKKDHPVLGALNHYLNLPVSIQIPMKVTSCSVDFKESITDLDFLHRENVSQTKDAYVDMTKPDFPIVEEVYGNNPDPERFFEDILACIELGQTRFQFNEEDYIARPKVKSDDPQLLAYQKFCRDYLGQKITYNIGEDPYTLSQDELLELLDEDLSGKADEEAVTDFVKKIAKKYDNIEAEKTTFKTFAGKTVTVEEATYGWSVDQEGEAAQLVKDINSHKDVSREPVWATQGFGEYKDGIGNTYIDIDVTLQRLTYYEDGQKKISFDVVTGCRNTGTTTPTGLFSVLNKATNINLKGSNVDGSKYTSFVNYWMAFLGSSYGMHDATWRSSFGGDIWITSGSHGCVNCPPDRIPELYNMVEYNTPVLIHY